MFGMKAQRDGSVAGACEADMVKLPQNTQKETKSSF